MHPSIALRQHIHEQLFHLLPSVITPQKEFFDGRDDCGVASVNHLQCLASCSTIQLHWLLVDLQAATHARKQWLLESQRMTERINRGDAKLCWKVEQVPAVFVRMIERSAGQRLHRSLIRWLF